MKHLKPIYGNTFFRLELVKYFLHLDFVLLSNWMFLSLVYTAKKDSSVKDGILIQPLWMKGGDDGYT